MRTPVRLQPGDLRLGLPMLPRLLRHFLLFSLLLAPLQVLASDAQHQAAEMAVQARKAYDIKDFSRSAQLYLQAWSLVTTPTRFPCD